MPNEPSKPETGSSARLRPVRPKYQVFVSSTFTDLHEERMAVTWEILKAGHIPVGMESFSAEPDRGWKVINRTLETTDYYVLILAGQYGSIDQDLGISWTEREYRRAIELGIPVLAFVRDERFIRGDQVDKDDKAKKLSAFIADVQKAWHRERWTTADDLRARVSVALLKAIGEDQTEGNERPGWYRGNLLPSPATVDELAKLSTENRNLREEVQALQARLAPTTRVIFEVLDRDGAPIGNIVQRRPRYAVEYDRRSTPMVYTVMGVGPDDVDKLLAKVNRTFWFALQIRNAGNRPAKNVTTDLRIKGADDVALYRDHLPNIVATTFPTWATDPSAHVYVEWVQRASHETIVRQRIKQIGAGSVEHLVRLGLRGTLQHDTFLQFEVIYSIANEDGERLEGSIGIEVTLDDLKIVSVDALEKLSG